MPSVWLDFRRAVERPVLTLGRRGGDRFGSARVALGEERADLAAQLVLDDVHFPPGVQGTEAELVGHRGVFLEERLLISTEALVDVVPELHDLQVLQTHVAAVQAQAAERSLPDAWLAIVGRALEDECRHLHAGYVAAIPKLTDLIEQARTSVVPELAQRARALKMTLKDRLVSRTTGRPRRSTPQVA